MLIGSPGYCTGLKHSRNSQAAERQEELDCVASANIFAARATDYFF